VPTRTSYLIDTGIIIRQLRGDTRAGELLNALSASGEIATAAVTAFEIYRGCRSQSDERAASALFDLIPVIELTHEIARAGGAIMRAYPGVFSSDRAAIDALIAGTAIVAEAALVTLNAKQFARTRIVGLDALVLSQDSPDWISAVIG